MKKYLLGAFLVIAMNLFGAKLSDVKGIEKLKARDIKPVDIITFGSPCQNFSTAGDLTGLTGEKSSLFHQAKSLSANPLNKTTDCPYSTAWR